jgi:hypothetical protein
VRTLILQRICSSFASARRPLPSCYGGRPWTMPRRRRSWLNRSAP